MPFVCIHKLSFLTTFVERVMSLILFHLPVNFSFLSFSAFAFLFITRMIYKCFWFKLHLVLWVSKLLHCYTPQCYRDSSGYHRHTLDQANLPFICLRIMLSRFSHEEYSPTVAGDEIFARVLDSAYAYMSSEKLKRKNMIYFTDAHTVLQLLSRESS